MSFSSLSLLLVHFLPVIDETRKASGPALLHQYQWTTSSTSSGSQQSEHAGQRRYGGVNEGNQRFRRPRRRPTTLFVFLRERESPAAVPLAAEIDALAKEERERTGRVRPRSKEKIKRATWGSSHRDICRDFESETEGIAYHSRETGRERPSSNRRFDFHRTSPRPWPAKFNSLSSRDGKEKATAVESPMPLLV